MPYALNQGVRIYWEEEGAGDPLLMIMGLGFSMAMWGDLRSFLARRFRVILFDNRSAGKSDDPIRPFTLDTMASDAVAVLRAAGVETAHVFGMSMGGMIAQQVTLRNPDRVHKLILGCTHCGGLRTELAEMAAIRTLTSPFMTRAARLAAIVPFLYDPQTPRERIEQDLERVRANPPTVLGYLKQLAAIVFWGAYDFLPRIKAETLILHGEGDRVVPVSNGRILAERIPGAKLVVLAHAGHVFPTDQPERTRQELSQFLAASA